MENLIIIIISVAVVGFGVTIFLISKLLIEQKQTNENFSSSNKILTDIKTQLEKMETIQKEHKSTSKEGFTQIEKALQETIKLD